MTDTISQPITFQTAAVATRPDFSPDLEAMIHAADGTLLRYAEWRPGEKGSQGNKKNLGGKGEKLRGTILLIHGYGEHMGRYGRLARAWTEQGFVVGGCDHRGMGKSGGGRAYVRDYGEYVADALLAQARLRDGIGDDAPHLVYGHSMGGLVALRYAEQANKNDVSPLAGMMLSGPLVGVHIRFPFWYLWLIKAASNLTPRQRIPIKFDATILTHDPDEQAALMRDPLMLETTTPAWFAATKVAMDANHAAASRITCPTLWLIPGEDKLCDPQASRAFFATLPDGSARHTWREYPGLFHELHNERPDDRARVLADVTAWLNQVLSDKG